MWGFQGGQVSHVFKTSTTPMCVLVIKFEQNGSAPCWFWNVVSPYMPWFGVAMAAPFWFPSLWRTPTTLPLCSPWWSPHLEHHRWHPILLWFDPWVWPSHCSMLWFPLVTPRMFERHPWRSKIPWTFCPPLLDLLLPCFRKLVHFLHSEAYLPLFPLFIWFKGRIKECTFPLDSDDKWKSMCSCDSSLGLGTFSFLLFFFGVVGIFTDKPTLALVPPFLWAMGEKIFPFYHYLTFAWKGLCSLLHHLFDVLNLFLVFFDAHQPWSTLRQSIFW